MFKCLRTVTIRMKIMAEVFNQGYDDGVQAWRDEERDNEQGSQQEPGTQEVVPEAQEIINEDIE
jgi:hypothetical protein